MKKINKVNVYYHDQPVGTLAKTNDGKVAFEYDKEWVIHGFSISPLSLPLQPGVFIPRSAFTFNGLFGVFADSLPDGWGALLTDRMLAANGMDPEDLGILERLTLSGSSGRGALEYRPVWSIDSQSEKLSLDELAQESLRIFQDQTSHELDTIYSRGGTSGGARPKTNIAVAGEPWIVKFPCSFDPANIAKIEFDYMECAEKCGITVPEYRLFNNKFFGMKRFDRNGSEKIHMLSASALFEISHRDFGLSYEALMKATRMITGSADEVWKVFDLMCFNVMSHNQDDHSNNFSFLYNNGKWIFSPAYDLTYSTNYFGEHSTTVCGKGKDISLEDLVRAGREAGLNELQCQRRAEDIQKNITPHLKKYLGR